MITTRGQKLGHVEEMGAWALEAKSEPICWLKFLIAAQSGWAGAAGRIEAVEKRAKPRYQGGDADQTLVRRWDSLKVNGRV